MVSIIQEHIRMANQTVYVHLIGHDVNPQSGRSIKWKILHRNVIFHAERKIFEALEIKRHSQNIMNGCIGRTLDI